MSNKNRLYFNNKLDLDEFSKIVDFEMITNDSSSTKFIEISSNDYIFILIEGLIYTCSTNFVQDSECEDISFVYKGKNISIEMFQNSSFLVINIDDYKNIDSSKLNTIFLKKLDERIKDMIEFKSKKYAI